MIRSRLSSLRSRMLALWLVILAAALALRLYATAEEQSLEAARARADVLRLAQHAAQDQARAVEGARQLLYVLAQEKWLLSEDPTACGAFLARVLEVNPVYENLGIVWANGSYQCSAIPISQPAAAAGRVWLQQASQARGFTTSDVQAGRADGRPVVALAHSVAGDSLAPPAAVVAFVDMAALSRLAAKTQLPEGAALTVVDAEGRVLARFPDHGAWMGETYPDIPAAGFLTDRDEGVAELAGADGVRRLHAFTRVPGTEGWYLSVGISSEAVSAGASANLRRNLVVLALISLVVLAVIWLGGDALVFAPVERLVGATKGLREGNLDTRLGPPYPSGELGQLTQAFDEMAVALRAQQAKTGQAEQQLQETGALLQRTFAGIGDAVLVAEPDTVTFINCNPAVERIFGYRPDELLGRSPEILHVSREMYEQFISLALPALRAEGLFRTEYPMRHKDGRILTCEHSLAVVSSEVTRWLAVVNVIRDVTERRRAEVALQQQAERITALARQLLQAQEEERRRIARELHDEVGQALTGLGLALDRLSRPAVAGASPGLEEAKTLVGQLLAQVRELALDLRPAMLDSLGLLHALLWHCEKYENQTGVRVDLSHSGLEGRRFAAEVETATYRIVQEALTNVARHAQAGEAIVRVQADRETLRLAIEDCGVGFDPEAALASGQSSGLGGMQERANSLGGRLTIESAPQLGTCVRAELPLTIPPVGGGGGQSTLRPPAIMRRRKRRQ